jgi:hypothetical protein
VVCMMSGLALSTQTSIIASFSDTNAVYGLTLMPATQVSPTLLHILLLLYSDCIPLSQTE